MNPIVAAALIAAASTGVVAIVGFWTSLRLAHSTAVRDRQAAVYQQILAFAGHRTETRRYTTRTFRYDAETEARIKANLDSYIPPNWFELNASVLAFCPDSVVRAFANAKNADDAVLSAANAHAEAVALNEAQPEKPDANNAIALQAALRDEVEKANQTDASLIAIVRDKLLGTYPEPGVSLLGKLIYLARSRTALR